MKVNMNTNPARLLVEPLGKKLNGISPSACKRKVVSCTSMNSPINNVKSQIKIHSDSAPIIVELHLK